MRAWLSCALLAAVYCAVDAGQFRNPPKVQLYSRLPGEYGKENILICHVSDFHPPDISIQLLRNNDALPNPEQTDLAFKPNWHFHLTQSATFSPEVGDKFLCRVDHGGRITDIAWDPNM